MDSIVDAFRDAVMPGGGLDIFLTTTDVVSTTNFPLPFAVPHELRVPDGLAALRGVSYDGFTFADLVALTAERAIPAVRTRLYNGLDALNGTRFGEADCDNSKHIALLFPSGCAVCCKPLWGKSYWVCSKCYTGDCSAHNICAMCNECHVRVAHIPDSVKAEHAPPGTVAVDIRRLKLYDRLIQTPSIAVSIGESLLDWFDVLTPPRNKRGYYDDSGYFVVCLNPERTYYGKVALIHCDDSGQYDFTRLTHTPQDLAAELQVWMEHKNEHDSFVQWFCDKHSIATNFKELD